MRAGGTLEQPPLQADRAPQWEFRRQPDDTYCIRLHGTELYVAITSEKTNSPIVLPPLANTHGQQWRLVKQRPWLQSRAPQPFINLAIKSSAHGNPTR